MKNKRSQIKINSQIMMLRIKVPWKIGKDTHLYSEWKRDSSLYETYNEEDDWSSQGVSNAGKGSEPHNWGACMNRYLDEKWEFGKWTNIDKRIMIYEVAEIHGYPPSKKPFRSVHIFVF